MRLLKISNKFACRESGMAFLETLVALALLGIIAIVFLSGLATTIKANVIADERTTAESLARSQMEWAKQTNYIYDTAGYSPAAIPADEDYAGYAAIITAEPLHSPDEGIQKITVTVTRNEEEILILESYKVDR